MHNHFDQYLNVKALIEEARPNTVLELGAANGDNTEKLLHLADELGYRLIVISPEYPRSMELEEGSEDIVDRIRIKLFRYEHPLLTWLYSISYVELSNMEDDSIDFCIIDTDHNYWTLQQELTELKRVMIPGGIVAIHDTESFANRNGTMNLGYFNTIDKIIEVRDVMDNSCRIKEAKTTWDGIDYPLEDILKEERPFKQAIEDTVPDWEVLSESTESQGAMALRKGF